MTKSSMTDGVSSVASPEDRGFCDEMLPRVSRTFALSIQALPSSLRDAVGVSYLLCRVVDTIEDDAKIRGARGALFDAFDAALLGEDETALARFERLSDEVSLGPTDAERELVKRAGAVFRVYRSLPRSQQVGIYPHVAEMSQGMREYSTRADETWAAQVGAGAASATKNASASGLRLKDLADLERYCYFVAGTVGGLLTSLFLELAPQSSDREAWLRDRATSFGLGLQLVNIVKDVAGDFERGDCFLPVELAEAHGLPLDAVLSPSHRRNGLALIRAICGRARVHLDRAAEYTLGWPADQADGQGKHIRLFCSVPLALAFATLREVEDGRDTLVAGRSPTVSRALVQEVFTAAVSATADDAALAGLFDRCRFGAIGRCPRPSEPTDKVVDTTRSTESVRLDVSGSSSTERTADKMQQGSDARQADRVFTGKVFITGAAGHLGANLLHRLVTEGRDVRVLLRPEDDNGAVDAIERATGKRVERAMGDLRDRAFMTRAMDGCESAYHVAAKVSTLGGTAEELRELFDCNVVGTANLLSAAREVGTKRVVVTGSLGAVGYDEKDTQKPSDESVPFYPFTDHLPYARTKMQVELESLKAVADGLDVVIATSCAVLGPWDYLPSRMGRTLIDFANGKLRAYVGGGFEFVSARDCAEGHVLAMKRGRTGQKYILSTEFTTVDQLMDIFEEVSGRPRPRLRLPGPLMAGIAQVSSFVLSSFFPKVPQRFTPAAVRILRQQRHADTTKAKTELGYAPTTVRAAIHDAYADFARRGLVPQSPSLEGASSGHAKVEPSRKKSNEEVAA